MIELIRAKIVDSLKAPIPSFTRRDVRIPTLKGKAVAVIGMRRTGKSTLLWQILQDRLGRGYDREALLYFSFEDERLAGMKAANLSLIVEEYFTLHPEYRDKRTVVFFFDEIQVVPGWETFARRIMDSEKIELLISGSSSRLLSREVATSMRGRGLEAVVHPFSFREYLRHLGEEPDVEYGRLPKADRSRLGRKLREYLERGGFPETIGSPSRDRTELLRSYVDTALLRDVVERHRVSHPVALRWMIRHLFGNAAGAFTVNKFYGDLRSQGIPVSRDTLHEYLAHLEDAFLIRIVWLSTGSERQRMVNARKIYPIDSGLIPVYDRSGSANIGHALETCVMLELERRGADVSYHRNPDRSEVDFVAEFRGGPTHLVQVCARLDDHGVRERELRSLVLAERPGRTAEKILLTLDPEQPKDLPRGIHWFGALEWFLQS